MLKKLLSFLLCIGLLWSLCLPGFASEDLPLIVDKANLLSTEEEAKLEAKTRDIQGYYDTDVVIVTVDSLEGWPARDYADNFFDQNGYGFGDKDNGILFLLAMEEREWYISVSGDTIFAVTDYGVEQLGEAAVWYFSNGDYYTGFDVYLDVLEELLISYGNGFSVDGYAGSYGEYYHGYQEEIVYAEYYEKESSPSILLSLIIGVAIAAITVGSMRRSMNTKRPQRGASNYLRDDSFHLRTHQDFFLYSNISKVRKPQNTGSSSSRGGSSSVHRSASGRRHGGGGGKF